MVEPRFVDRALRNLTPALVPALLLAAVLAGCSDDGANAGGSASTTTDASTSSSSSTTAPTTTTTQPPSSDLAGIEPFIVDLLGGNDEAVAGLRADPARVNDPSDEALADYQSLYTADSPQAQAYVDTVRGLADAGTADRPGPSGVLEDTTLVELLPGDDPNPDVIFFQFCGYTDFETVVVATGEVQARAAIKTIGGGEARRIEGVWLLHDFQVPDDNLVSELPPGTANPCELEG